VLLTATALICFSVNQKGLPATKKIGMLPAVMSQLNKVIFIEVSAISHK